MAGPNNSMIDMPALLGGQVLPVVLAPNPILSTSCADANPRDVGVIQLAADLLATMDASPGCVGLAANQVGVALRVFSLDVSKHPKTRKCHGRLVLINPILEEATRNEKAREGCLSVPDFTGDVKRATRVTVRGLLPVTGQNVVFESDAFEARAIQHEIDHLAGLVFLDRVAGAHAIYPRKVYR